MKKFRKLIPATAMLLISALLMGTSTFAWFSLNKTVTATNMSITAKADNPFLQIKENGNTGDYNTSATLTAAGTELALVTPTNIAHDAMTWAYATSTDPAEPQIANPTTPLTLTPATSGTAKVLSTAAGVNYVLQQDLVCKLVDNGNSATNLKVSKVHFGEGTNSIAASGRLLVVSTEGYQLFKLVNGDVTAAESGSSDALIASPVAGTEYTFNCYFYFDGTDSSAYTNNATDLTAVTAVITLTID